MDKEWLKQLTQAEKVSFLRGVGSWETYYNKKIDNPTITMSDGPIGIRKEIKNQGNGMGIASKSVCYPSGALLACSFSKDVFSLLGTSLALEAKAKEVQVVLGPAMNIKRSPLGGRGFEYLSEDPYLTSILASSYVTSMQENGVGACVKHYAVNSSESNRMVINEVVDERALREIYLYAFEHVIKECNPSMLMASYNKVNGLHATENPYLLTDLLRKEWNYQGLVVSDWYAVNDPVNSILAGLDLEMPEDEKTSYDVELKEIKKNPDFEKRADESIMRQIDLAMKYPKENGVVIDQESHHQIAKKLAEESIVLLKNEEDILPLKKTDKISVIGAFSKEMRYQGGGSSHIESYRVPSFVSLLKDIDYQYADGYILNSETKLKNLKETKKVASNADKVLLFLGVSEKEESEGFDRSSLSLNQNQLELIKEIKKVNPNIIVILSSGGPLEMPFLLDVKGVIETYLGGEAIAEALYSILYGEVNPSGHLAETFPISIKDTPCYSSFPGDRYNSFYQESIYVGYRYYETKKVPVLFPFGYGLSYSSFSYSNFQYNQEKNEVSFFIKNNSAIKGKAVPQIYISKPNDVIFNSKVELCGFDKIELEPEEEKEIRIPLSKEIFTYFDVRLHSFTELFGTYQISLRSDAHTIISEIAFEHQGQNNPCPYSKEKIPSYFSADIQHAAKEFSSLFLDKVPSVVGPLPFSYDTSLIQAKERGSLGAKYLIRILMCSKTIRKNKMIQASVIEVPIRVLMYMQKDLYYHKERFLDLLKDDHLFLNLIFVISKLIKLSKLVD